MIKLIFSFIKKESRTTLTSQRLCEGLHNCAEYTYLTHNCDGLAPKHTFKAFRLKDARQAMHWASVEGRNTRGQIGLDLHPGFGQLHG